MSWAVVIQGRPAGLIAALAEEAAARLTERGEPPVILKGERFHRALGVRAARAEALRGARDRALAYVAATLVHAGIPVIVEASDCSAAWGRALRPLVPDLAAVWLGGDQEAPESPADLLVDPAEQEMGEASAALVDLVRRRFWRVRERRPETPIRADRDQPDGLLFQDTDEQREIGRRARAHAADLIASASANRRRAAARLHDQRRRMVEEQIAARGVRDARVLDAMRSVRREEFLPDRLVPEAYRDEPLPIGEGQTISQPYVVAAMAEALRLTPGDRVLEIGTGSGYAAAVLALLAADVCTIERIRSLAESARERLAALGHDNVHVRWGDGTLGWPERAPFDAIAVPAGGPDVPRSLLRQLAVGGRLVMPVGSTPRRQRLVRVVRTGPETFDREELEEVAFVPLIGAEGWPEAAGARGPRETPTLECGDG